MKTNPLFLELFDITSISLSAHAIFFEDDLSYMEHPFLPLPLFVAFVEDNATMSSIRYFENHASYLVQNRRK